MPVHIVEVSRPGTNTTMTRRGSNYCRLTLDEHVCISLELLALYVDGCLHHGIITELVERYQINASTISILGWRAPEANEAGALITILLKF